MSDPGGSAASRSGGDGSAELARPGWRRLLRERALGVWTRGAFEPLTAEQLDILTTAFGPLLQDVVAIVEAFALGARVTVGAGGELPPGVATRLDLLLNSFDAIADEQTARLQLDRATQSHVIQSDLWQVLHKVRESAELSYARERDLIELDRRILMMLQTAGPMAPADISSAVGVDKAQVSRSVKRLLELGVAERDQLRSPLRLTIAGEGLSSRLLRLAELRNRELTFDISDEELESFSDTIELLVDRAVALYDQERELAAQVPARADGEADGDAETRNFERRIEGQLVIDRKRIVPSLMTLLSYFARSGGLAFKRLTGLSRFEAFVMSEVGRSAPVDWSTLVNSLHRDHSQASRTLNALMERRLITRSGRPGRRHGRFSLTDAGQELFAIIQQAGNDRSTFLMAPLERDRRVRFLAIFDKIRRNASAQLERERAFAEFEQH
ncbi:MarR family transcriptional regulator [Altererythrobacter xixiisoli]|uniref:MarR family transcriptional regulator n=1 Tax=Croceibacterium xixiisoli TaxID=1476466 RepID=A0A6I4TVV3_9SPHN|nr:MarR family transcriptional regulator [Croceibacterium xixiisoli]MXO99952.1 MarR family transcriptional regulator [Croceibacterium xixiisoli]